MFPNRFNVYLHDTPSKSLFDKDLRVFSHGCMRVQNPLDLAELLLADQGWSGAHRRHDRGGKQRIINLQDPIPVHVTYLTAWVNKDGRSISAAIPISATSSLPVRLPAAYRRRRKAPWPTIWPWRNRPKLEVRR